MVVGMGEGLFFFEQLRYISGSIKKSSNFFMDEGLGYKSNDFLYT
jgi:hypothetical protein